MAKGMYVGSSKRAVALTNTAPVFSTSNYTCVPTGRLTTDTTHTKYTGTALKMVATSSDYEVYMTTTTTYPLVSTHVYYIRCEVYQETVDSNSWGFGCYFPIAEPAFFVGKHATANQWTIVSGVGDRSSFSDGNYQFRFDFDNNYTNGTVWFDGVMLVDLTAAFGAGNEPTKEWCDAHIPYFTGTTSVEIDTGVSVAHKVKKMYVGVGNVARKVKTGYVGVGNVARKFHQELNSQIGQTWTFITDGTFTVLDDGTYSIEIHGGGGGGGGGAHWNDRYGGASQTAVGGNGGGSGELYTTTLKANTTYSITIGYGGVGGKGKSVSSGTATGATGGTGGTTRFGSLYSVSGGTGGTGGTAGGRDFSQGSATNGSIGTSVGTLASGTSGGCTNGSYGNGGSGGSGSSDGVGGTSGAVIITFLG